METEEVNAETTVTTTEPIKADVEVLKFVNLALVQNGLPALQDLRVTNETDEVIKDVVCAFSSDDGFIVPNQKVFKEIEAHGSVGSHNVDVLLNQRRIVEVRSEPAVGTIKMTVSVGGEVKYVKSYTMTILPVDTGRHAAAPTERAVSRWHRTRNAEARVREEGPSEGCSADPRRIEDADSDVEAVLPHESAFRRAVSAC